MIIQWIVQQNCEIRAEGSAWAAATELATTLGQPQQMHPEATHAPGGNPHRHEESMQTPHREVLPQLGIKAMILLTLDKRTSLLWGNSANHQATVSAWDTHRFSSDPSIPIDVCSVCLFFTIIHFGQCVSSRYTRLLFLPDDEAQRSNSARSRSRGKGGQTQIQH